MNIPKKPGTIPSELLLSKDLGISFMRSTNIVVKEMSIKMIFSTIFQHIGSNWTVGLSLGCLSFSCIGIAATNCHLSGKYMWNKFVRI